MSNLAPVNNAVQRLVYSMILVVTIGLVSPDLMAADNIELTAVQNVAESINQVGSTGEMNKTLAIAFFALIFLVLPVVTWVVMHNSLISKEEAAFSAWSQVESNYQRRSDLIPALTDTVSRYIRHEADTLTEITSERSKAHSDLQTAAEKLKLAQASSDSSLKSFGGKPPADETAISEMTNTQEQVQLGMKGLLAIVENYPDLRSSDQFLTLQAQLEGTENRINVARMRFNEAASDFNAAIRMIPSSLIASVANMKRKAYFRSDEGVSNAQKLDFD